MTRTLLAFILAASVAAPAFAQDATGGPSGGPNQAQAVVPKGATGGRSGGPNQAQAVVPKGATGGRSGGPNQSQYVKKAHAHSKKKHR